MVELSRKTSVLVRQFCNCRRAVEMPYSWWQVLLKVLGALVFTLVRSLDPFKADWSCSEAVLSL